MSKRSDAKHGIEVRYGRGRKLNLLSYAVYRNGNCEVSHATTAFLRRAGNDLNRMVKIEQERSALPTI